jgi:outer membrane protein assembly factor BamB
MHLCGQSLGTPRLETEGGEVRLGPFSFAYDRKEGTLRGVVPEGFAPVYRIPLVLRRVASAPACGRPAPEGTPAEPVWSLDVGSPLWAGPTVAGGVVYVGGDDGRLVAADAASGKEIWSFRAGGPIRTRPAVAEGSLYFQADDGFVYRLGAGRGEERWRVRVVATPIVRLPFDDPKSRFDRLGSDVAVVGERLYLGTHDGRLLALDASDGRVLWQFQSGDSVLAAPVVAGGRVFFGSFDKSVYALDATSGRLLWKRDTQGAVVSTPALDDGRLVIGNRTYDVLCLEATSGEVAWKRYVWFSWIESSASIRDGVAYVGSSDAAAVLAFDVATGRLLWTADVRGWAWGQPAVTASRVYEGTSSQVGYPAGHAAGVVALDRQTGRTVWRYASAPPERGAFGFPGSPAVGSGLVFVGGLDGRLLALRE